MKKAILITKDNWEELSNQFGLPGPMRKVFVDRYYVVDNSPWYARLFGYHRAILIGEPGFTGEYAKLGRMKVRREWPTV